MHDAVAAPCESEDQICERAIALASCIFAMFPPPVQISCRYTGVAIRDVRGCRLLLRGVTGVALDSGLEQGPQALLGLRMRLPGMSSGQLHDAVVAMAAIGLKPQDPLTEDALLCALQAVLPSLTHAEKVACMSAVAELGLRPSVPWMVVAAEALTSGAGLGSLVSRELLDLTAALAALASAQPLPGCRTTSQKAAAQSASQADVMGSLLVHVERAWSPHLPRLGISELSRLVSLLARARHRPREAWLAGLGAAAAQRLRDSRLALHASARRDASSEDGAGQQGGSDAAVPLLRRKPSRRKVREQGLKAGVSDQAASCNAALPELFAGLAACGSHPVSGPVWPELWATSAAFLRAEDRMPGFASLGQAVDTAAAERRRPLLLVEMARAAAELWSSCGVAPPNGWLRLLAESSERRAPSLGAEDVVGLTRDLAVLGARQVLRRRPRADTEAAAASSMPDAFRRPTADGETQVRPREGAESRSQAASEPFEALGRSITDLLPHLEPSQLAVICQNLPLLKPPRTHGMAQALAAAAARHADNVGPSALPLLALALADSRGSDDLRATAAQAVASASLECMARMGGRELAALAGSLARMGCRPSRAWMSRFLPLVLRNLPLMPADSLSRTVWALAKLRCRPPTSWWQPVLKEAAGKMSTFEAKHLSIFIWAVATSSLGSGNGSPAGLLEQAWLARFYDKLGCQMRLADSHR